MWIELKIVEATNPSYLFPLRKGIQQTLDQLLSSWEIADKINKSIKFLFSGTFESPKNLSNPRNRYPYTLTHKGIV